MSDPQNRAEALDDDKMATTDRPVEDLEYPPDEPTAVEDYGTTPAEEHVDEPIAERVTREVPPAGGPADEPTGRLIEPGPDEVGAPDEEPDAVARGVPASDLSAEEAAVHDTADPPMDPDDGYVEEEPPLRGNEIRP